MIIPSPQFKIQDWLYGEWSEEKYGTFKALYSIPGIREYFDYLLDMRSDSEYMNRYQLDWSDIHDPRKLSSTGSTSRLVGSAYRMIGRNINSLYR